MQAHAAGSNSAVTDENSLSSSLCYSNLLDRQIQNHVMAGYPSPSSLGEAIISFSRNNMSTRFADESLNIQTGKSTPTDFSGTSYHQICSIHDMETSHPFPYPFESPKTVITDSSSVMNPTFGSTSYGFEDFPFVQSNPLLLMSGFSKELSLSLPASQPSVVQCSETNSLRKRHIGSDNKSCNSSNSLSLNDNSYKSPLQDRPILSGSRFFHAMQEILAEIACYALENFDQVSYSDERSCSRTGFSNHGSKLQNNFLHEQNAESKKKHLLSLLQVVDDQYNQCVDEVHTVISAFHAVTELDPNLHAQFALPTISLMYRNLREKISSHILAMGSILSEREDNSFETSFVQRQWALQQLRKGDHQQWRPQRGLPERSVSVLRAWMFQNFLHPYPKDSEKHLLALKSGLTRSQVSNWFINARVRLWKPMIEEMYAEMNRRKAQRNEEETNGTLGNLLHFENRRFTID